MEERSDAFVRKFVLVFGVLLVVFGGVILFYFGYLVLQVINHPEEVRLVEYIRAQFQSGDLAFYGSLDEKQFTVHLAEPLKTAVFLFLGMLIVWVLARIVQSLISGGLKMLSFALGRSRSTRSKGTSEAPQSYDLSELESQ